ncbi:MAG: 50S ribosomal protein L4, partial [Acholeplasmataceae bacterium]
KLFVETLNKLNASNKTIVLTRAINNNLVYASNNVPRTLLKEVSQASVLELLNYKTVILTLDAVKYYEEVLG